MIRIVKISSLWSKREVKFSDKLVGTDGKLNMPAIENSEWVGDNDTIEVDGNEACTREYTFSVIELSTELQCVELLNRVMDEHGLTVAVDLFGWIKSVAYINSEDDIVPVFDAREFRPKESFVIRDREAGNKIDWFDTAEDAKEAREAYLVDDKKEGIYDTGNFYEIYDTYKEVEVD